TTGRRSLPSPTTGQASALAMRPVCSTPSIGPTLAAAGIVAALVWGCPSWRPLWVHMAGGGRGGGPKGEGRPSGAGSHWLPPHYAGASQQTPQHPLGPPGGVERSGHTCASQL